METFILKHFDRDLVRFEVRDIGEEPEVRLLQVYEGAQALMPLGMEVSGRGISSWLRHRKIPRNRAFIHTLLARAGLSPNATMGIIRISRGLSLNDCHWVVPEGFRKSFAQCNLYENRFSEVLAELAFTGYGSSVRSSLLSSPEFTTNGMLAKCWRRQSGRIYLFKGGTEGASNTGNEPYSEFLAWQVAEAMGISAIPYSLAKWKSRLCSRCELFTSIDVSYVPVGSIVRKGGMQAVINLYQSMGAEYADALEDMFVFDAVIANTDRHLGNFGFLVDSRSNAISGPAPLFDHGNSLFNFASVQELESTEAFERYADAQRPVCYSDFLSAAKLCLRRRHLAALRRILQFEFRKHPRYNLPAKRLRLIEACIRKRASKLLGEVDTSRCELRFDTPQS